MRIRDLGLDDVVVETRFWTDLRRSDFVATTSSVRQAIVAALKVANIALPDPNVRILVPRHPQKCPAAFGLKDGDSASS